MDQSLSSPSTGRLSDQASFHKHFKTGGVPMIERRMEQELGLEFLRVVELAAIGAAHPMGKGDRKYFDHVAGESMRQVMDTVPVRGEIVIGEGQRHDAPMLY